VHLYEGDPDTWNTRTVREKFAGQAVVLSEFCWRQRGLVIKPELKDRIQTIADLKGHRITPRQASAGSQILLLHLMAQQGIDAGDVDFGELAYTETDAVTSILDGSADATLGLRSVARRFKLDFVPLMRERFDLLVDRRAWFEPVFQTFLSFCQSAAFRERAESLQDYDVSGIGSIHFNG
jgi:molybdate-binding protein